MEKYHLNLVTEVSQLEPLITKISDQVFELKNNRDDALIASRKGLEAAERKANAIQKATADLASKTANFGSETDPRKKQTLEGEIKILEGQLIKLNVPDETEPLEVLILKALKAEQLNREIAGAEEFLADCQARKTQLESGSGN